MSQLAALRQAAAVSPDNLPLQMLYAQACLDEFALDEGRAAFEKALQIAPNDPAPKLGLARTLHLMGRTSEAVVRVEAITGQFPRFALAWLFLARLTLGEGNREAANSHYRKALELDGGVADPALEKELYLDQPREQQRAAMTTSGSQTFETDESGDPAIPETDGLGQFERPTISFAEVGGMDSVKEEIRMKILYPLQNPDLFRAYGKKIGGGVLLYGPPGCGKTLLSRATAGEIKANFLAIGIHEILDMWIGNSEKNLHRIFELARDHQPTVLFFDEVDALAADRNDMKQSAGRTLINQFLAEMDGTNANNDGLLILGATNAPWHIDSAFRRPGRFDRILFVPPPDDDARAAVIDVMAKGKPVHNLDARALAKKTKDFSGADLKSVFDLTTERVLSKAMKEGRIVPITTDELIRTAKDVKPTARAWFESAKNYALYANQGGFYDDVLSYLGIRK
ncbi:MAG: AAA family ATPase [Chthoniobacteraceae bacterium]